jgi:hypothetical protein
MKMSEEMVDFVFSKGELTSPIKCPKCKIPIELKGKFLTSVHYIEGEYCRMWYFEDKNPIVCCNQKYALPLCFDSERELSEFYFSVTQWARNLGDENFFESEEFPLTEMLYDDDTEEIKGHARPLD